MEHVDYKIVMLTQYKTNISSSFFVGWTLLFTDTWELNHVRILTAETDFYKERRQIIGVCYFRSMLKTCVGVAKYNLLRATSDVGFFRLE